MTYQQILEQAIEKAIDGGWARKRPLPNLSVDNLAYDALCFGIPYVNTIIFNHEFAKALWGEDKHECLCYGDDSDNPWCCEDSCGSRPMWQYHLQQMVVADDPIKYLEAHI